MRIVILQISNAFWYAVLLHYCMLLLIILKIYPNSPWAQGAEEVSLARRSWWRTRLRLSAAGKPTWNKMCAQPAAPCCTQKPANGNMSSNHTKHAFWTKISVRKVQQLLYSALSRVHFTKEWNRMVGKYCRTFRESDPALVQDLEECRGAARVFPGNGWLQHWIRWLGKDWKV